MPSFPLRPGEIGASLLHLDIHVINRLLELGERLVPCILESLAQPSSLTSIASSAPRPLPLPNDVLSILSAATSVPHPEVVTFWSLHSSLLLDRWAASLHNLHPPDPRADDRLLMSNFFGKL